MKPPTTTAERVRSGFITLWLVVGLVACAALLLSGGGFVLGIAWRLCTWGFGIGKAFPW